MQPIFRILLNESNHVIGIYFGAKKLYGDANCYNDKVEPEKFVTFFTNEMITITYLMCT